MALVGTRSGGGTGGGNTRSGHVMTGVGERGALPPAHHSAILAAAPPGGFYAHLDPRGQAPHPQATTGAMASLQSSGQPQQGGAQPSTPPGSGNAQEVTPDRPIGYGAFGVVW